MVVHPILKGPLSLEPVVGTCAGAALARRGTFLEQQLEEVVVEVSLTRMGSFPEQLEGRVAEVFPTLMMDSRLGRTAQLEMVQVMCCH